MRKRIGIAAFGLAVGTLLAIAFLRSPIPQVQAQGGGPGVSFTLSFNVPISASRTIIPACSATVVNPPLPAAPICIPNFNQLAHTVGYQFASSSGVPNTCPMFFEQSFDNAFWQITAASGDNGLYFAGSFSANGYFPYNRIVVQPCSFSAITLIYTGFGGPLQITPQSFTALGNPYSVSTYTAIQVLYTPTMLTGFQCANPNATPAYLQFVEAVGAPSLGISNYQVVIPATTTFVFAGPPLLLFNFAAYTGTFWAGASTTPSGVTAVAIPVLCNFETNSTGPYYPFNVPTT